MRVAVVSAIYGGYDQPLVPVEQDWRGELEWLMVTDVLEPAPAPWVSIIEPRSEHPRMAAKRAKCHPELYALDADVTIWIDGNLQVTAPDFVSWCIQSLGGADLCQHRNAARLSIDDEVGAASACIKYEGQGLIEQAASYVAEGYPPGYGTWWTGLIVKSAHCPRFGGMWHEEMDRWTPEDQISQPYVLWRHGLVPAPLEITWQGIPELECDRFTLVPHRDSL